MPRNVAGTGRQPERAGRGHGIRRAVPRRAESSVDFERRAVEESPPEEIRKEWYILKVQSNREESIREGLMRRVAMAGLERFFGECIVPTEMVSEFKGGKKRVIKRKLYPGYLVVHMEINDDTWFLVRETPGIGDFTGSVGRPSPMLAARSATDSRQERRKERGSAEAEDQLQARAIA